MNKKVLVILLILTSLCSFAQSKYTFSGTIKDSLSGETLIGVSVIIPELKTGTMTNEYGFYSISLPQEKYKVQVQYLGFKTEVITIDLNKDVQKNFFLKEESTQLNEIVLTRNVDKIAIKKPEMSVNTLPISKIKSMPAILGEVDVLKSILTLPGVTNAGEGQSGFNVRGGAVDQNLILLDEATVYNSSHLFGFFSVFNSDAIKDLKLYKGGIPARFGGRVASVLDIYQREGNQNEFHMNGGIGLISSRLLAEGPIKKDKGAFLVAGRSSYAHLFLKLTDNENSAYFYDLNTMVFKS